jgi:hypothetical protein
MDLYPAGPGCARLLITGPELPAETIELALQRNDGRYLGTDRQWQLTAHWHPLFAAEPRPEGLRLTLGADLVDSIVGLGGAPLRIAVRRDGVEDAGMLRIRGSLIGSGAAAPAQTGLASDPVRSQARLVHSIDQPALDAADRGLTLDPAAVGTGAAETSVSRRWPWVLALAFCLLAGLGVATWWWGWRDTGQSTDAPSPELAETVATGSEGGADGGSDRTGGTGSDVGAESPDLRLSGLALAKAFLAGGPTAAAIFARAQELEQAADCDAAYALYSEAANREPAYAVRLARRYDPGTHEPGPCITAPDIPYAIVYYDDAAQSGDRESQRRLGQLMVEREPSGPTHDAGLGWLRRAAAAGDEEARSWLERHADE